MTVGRLLTEIDAEELAHWEAYYSWYPFPQERVDIANAINTSVLANAHSSKRRKYKPKDFIVDYKPKDFIVDVTTSIKRWGAFIKASENRNGN